MIEKISYKIEGFEGPLDLILHLIAKNRLNIYDIQISKLLEQYMEHINRMQEQNLDVESEFLEMAAKLVYIKTASLLPRHEEADALKEELTGRLLEYQECRRVAALLGEMLSFDRFVREPVVLEADATYRRSHAPQELQEAYLAAAGRGKRKLPPPVSAFSGIVSHRVVSVGSRIIFVLRRLWNNREVEFGQLFGSTQSRSELVATFLAVLELVKAKRVRVEERDKGGPTLIMQTDGVKAWKLKKSSPR